MDIDSKAKAMCKTATNKMSAEALAAYEALSLKRADFDGLILTTDGKTINLESKIDSKTKSVKELLGDVPRFVIVENGGKLILICWGPEGGKAMEKMKYNSVKGALEKELGNLKCYSASILSDLENIIG